MSEFSAPAQLTPDGGSPLLFNQIVSATGYSYRLRITGPIEGIDSPVLRVSELDAPMIDGFDILPIRRGGHRLVVEGTIDILGAATDTVYVGGRNAVEKLIRDTLAACQDIDAPAEWAWTPTGLTEHSLSVLNNVEVRFRGAQFKSFMFGLVSPASTITVA